MGRTLTLLRRPRWIVGALVVLTAAAAFTAAGMWQLRRLDERRAENAAIEQARALPPLSQLPAALDGLKHRLVDVPVEYAGPELELTPQTLDGRAGSHRLSVAGSGPVLVVVDRGFVPLDEEASYPAVQGPARLQGRLASPISGGRYRDSTPRAAVTRMNLELIAERTGLDLATDYYVILEGAGTDSGVPTPRPPPELGEGPHLTYAIQWFSFVAIVLVGFAALLYRTARPLTPPPETRDRRSAERHRVP